MKNIIAALLLLLVFKAVPYHPHAQSVQLPNPMIAMASLEEVNEEAQVNLCLPPVMGVTDQSYTLLKGVPAIGELRYVLGGYSYTFRACRGTENDISGVWLEQGTAFPDHAGEGIAFARTEEVKLARWFHAPVQYVLMVEDKGELDENAFAVIAQEMADRTDPAF